MGRVAKEIALHVHRDQACQERRFLVNQLYAQGTITTPPPYRTLAEDRAWGPKTDANVRWFQKMVRVDQDGVVGPATGSRLLTLGDQGYNGSSLSGRGYCWNYLPGDFD
ncbi:Peptidoglycan-binding domain 1 protein [Actinobacteria bacterium OV450]|nr:Peptidoglycan-binding domain 1 protein [Actinobacteria bacterium OV450]